MEKRGGQEWIASRAARNKSHVANIRKKRKFLKKAETFSLRGL